MKHSIGPPCRNSRGRFRNEAMDSDGPRSGFPQPFARISGHDGSQMSSASVPCPRGWRRIFI